MIKMQIVMDDAKIRRERKYSVEQIRQTLDNYFVSKLGMEKSAGGFYHGTGSGKDFSRFGLAYSVLSEKDWFLDNVKTWLYYNSDASYDPEDYVVEDFKEHCLKRLTRA
jgi:NADH:ubiquinone oxidoreductase subunit